MLVQKSYTRITLALDIIRKIGEGTYKGYHELGIIKHRIDLYDIISIEASGNLIITCNNPQVPVDSSNLCRQAVEKIQQQFGIKENVHIHIEKNIPVKGGLAGGSSNAATVLSILNNLWNLDLDKRQLVTIARDIGMDVPFYFTGGTAFDTETTGILEPVKTDIVFNFVLAIPDFGVSTSEAYKRINYNETGREKSKTARMKEALENNDKDSAIDAMHNDFEKTVFKQHPRLESLKEKLLKAGCLNAVMSGSGSTLVGVAKDKEHTEWIKNSLSNEYTIVQVSTYC